MEDREEFAAVQPVRAVTARPVGETQTREKPSAVRVGDEFLDSLRAGDRGIEQAE